MTQDNDGNGFIDSLISMGLFLGLFAILGMIFIAIWSIIKIPIWLVSPHRGGFELNEDKKFKVPLNMTLMSPYFSMLLWSSGVGTFMAMVFVANLNSPMSYLWTDNDFFWFAMSIMLIAYFLSLVAMLKELNMILNFENWASNNNH